MRNPSPRLTSSEIVARRGDRNSVDPRRPYAYLVEPECNAQGKIVDVATLFLTNRECPFRCLMCDLWKNTLMDSVAVGDIPEQIRWGLRQLRSSKEIKLYNSGNFFDPKAIPPADFPQIADLVRGFDRVIVENHPKLCGNACLEFRDLIAPAKLEVALGLETCHPEVLLALNKQMTLADYDRAATFLTSNNIDVRTFLLLRPPYLSEEEGVAWTMKSLRHAFDQGSHCCSIIPTRSGNGAMEFLEQSGDFAPPSGASLERVLSQGLALNRGRVFVDLWDAERFFPCNACRHQRIEQLQTMNLQQRLFPELIDCEACS